MKLQKKGKIFLFSILTFMALFWAFHKRTVAKFEICNTGYYGKIFFKGYLPIWIDTDYKRTSVEIYSPQGEIIYEKSGIIEYLLQGNYPSYYCKDDLIAIPRMEYPDMLFSLTQRLPTNVQLYSYYDSDKLPKKSESGFKKIQYEFQWPYDENSNWYVR